jgi:hypothetical protein
MAVAATAATAWRWQQQLQQHGGGSNSCNSHNGQKAAITASAVVNKASTARPDHEVRCS